MGIIGQASGMHQRNSLPCQVGRSIQSSFLTSIGEFIKLRQKQDGLRVVPAKNSCHKEPLRFTDALRFLAPASNTLYRSSSIHSTRKHVFWPQQPPPPPALPTPQQSESLEQRIGLGCLECRQEARWCKGGSPAAG